MDREEQEGGLTGTRQVEGRTAVTDKAIAKGALAGAFGRGAGYIVHYTFVAVCTRAIGSESAGAILAVLALVNVLGVLGRAGLDSCALREVAITFGHGDMRQARRAAITVLLAAGSFSVLLTVLVWSFRDVLGGFLGIEATPSAKLLLLLIPVISLCGVLGEVIRATKRVFAASATQLTIVYLIPVVMLMPGTLDYVSTPSTVFFSLLAGATLSFCFGVLVFLRVTRIRKGEFGRGRSRRLFAGAPAFMAMSVTTMYLANIDILLVSHFLEKTEVSLYVAASRTAMAISLGLIAVGGILASHFASAFAAADRKRLADLLNDGAHWCIFQGFIAAVVLIVLSRPILSVFGFGLASDATVLCTLVIGQFLNSAFGPLVVFLAMTHMEKFGARILVTTAIVATVLYVLAIENLGLIGAAIANVLTLIIWNASISIPVWRSLGSKAPNWRTVGCGLLLLSTWAAMQVPEMTNAETIAVATIAGATSLLFAWHVFLRERDRIAAIEFYRHVFRRETGSSSGRDEL